LEGTIEFQGYCQDDSLIFKGEMCEVYTYGSQEEKDCHEITYEIPLEGNLIDGSLTQKRVVSIEPSSLTFTDGHFSQTFSVKVSGVGSGIYMRVGAILPHIDYPQGSNGVENVDPSFYELPNDYVHFGHDGFLYLDDDEPSYFSSKYKQCQYRNDNYVVILPKGGDETTYLGGWRVAGPSTMGETTIPIENEAGIKGVKGNLDFVKGEPLRWNEKTNGYSTITLEKDYYMTDENGMFSFTIQYDDYLSGKDSVVFAVFEDPIAHNRFGNAKFITLGSNEPTTTTSGTCAGYTCGGKFTVYDSVSNKPYIFSRFKMNCELDQNKIESFNVKFFDIKNGIVRTDINGYIYFSTTIKPEDNQNETGNETGTKKEILPTFDEINGYIKCDFIPLYEFTRK